MRIRLFAAFVALLFAGTAPFALAHHGWSEYDAGHELTIEGTVVASAYENPHTVIRLKTASKTWVAVLAPPFRMEARGLKADAIKVGLKANLVGYPNRGKPEEMRAERIIVDGKTIELR